jgi:hypothetical protein
MEWYVARNGTTIGPVTFDQLADAAHTGRLSSDDLIWNDSMESWVPAATVPDLWHVPERKPAHSVWQRATKTSAARRDARPTPSSDRRLVRVQRWLLLSSISLTLIALALTLVAIY